MQNWQKKHLCIAYCHENRFMQGPPSQCQPHARRKNTLISSPRAPNFAVRGGKLGMYTLQNPSEVLLKLAPPGG